MTVYAEPWDADATWKALAALLRPIRDAALAQKGKK